MTNVIILLTYKQTYVKTRSSPGDITSKLYLHKIFLIFSSSLLLNILQ